MRIDFDIAAIFEEATFSESFAKFRGHQTDLINKIEEAKTSGSLDFKTTEGGIMEATSIDNAYVILKCPENMLPSYRSISCGKMPISINLFSYVYVVVIFFKTTSNCLLLLVKCAAGTFFDKSSDNCEMCPKGTYQPIAGQSDCLPCPPGRTTKTKGSQLLSQCEGTYM